MSSEDLDGSGGVRMPSEPEDGHAAQGKAVFLALKECLSSHGTDRESQRERLQQNEQRSPRLLAHRAAHSVRQPSAGICGVVARSNATTEVVGHHEEEEEAAAVAVGGSSHSRLASRGTTSVEEAITCFSSCLPNSLPSGQRVGLILMPALDDAQAAAA